MSDGGDSGSRIRHDCGSLIEMTEIKSSSSTARSNENEREDVITARQGQLINNFLESFDCVWLILLARWSKRS
ncbi:hypothetical protein Hdeb2414_s0008g00288601 [Helianthus debilis subsp. tardiflorus]